MVSRTLVQRKTLKVEPIVLPTRNIKEPANRKPDPSLVVHKLNPTVKDDKVDAVPLEELPPKHSLKSRHREEKSEELVEGVGPLQKLVFQRVWGIGDNPVKIKVRRER